MVARRAVRTGEAHARSLRLAFCCEEWLEDVALRFLAHAGAGVGQGNDYTLFALVEGVIQFDRKGRRVNIVAENN